MAVDGWDSCCRINVWEQVWKVLGSLGYADAIGGREYDRVTAEWIDAGRPIEDAGKFILDRTGCSSRR